MKRQPMPDPIAYVRERRQPRPEPAGELIHDEAIHIAKGETRYSIDLDQETVDALERGICPESLANRMHALMSWRREAIRAGPKA